MCRIGSGRTASGRVFELGGGATARRSLSDWCPPVEHLLSGTLQGGRCSRAGTDPHQLRSPPYRPGVHRPARSADGCADGQGQADVILVEDDRAESSIGALATHRAALEAGADPALITSWIAETQARRATAEAELRTATNTPTGRMTRDEITRLVWSISDLAPSPPGRPRGQGRDLPTGRATAHIRPRPDDSAGRDPFRTAPPEKRQNPTASKKPRGNGWFVVGWWVVHEIP